MNPAELDELIRVRVALGESQKSVAKDLGVTEWKVRLVVRQQLTETVIRREAKAVRLHAVKVSAAKAERVLVLSDVHIPYHDHGALAVAMAFAKAWKPTLVVLNGDILDAHQISTHPKNASNVITFQDEINEVRQFLRAIKRDHSKARIVYTMGNHEDRLERYLVNHSPELSSVQRLSLCELLDFAEIGIEFIDKRSKLRVGPVEIFHGTAVRAHAGNSVRAHMLRRGGGVVMGHTHRMATIARTDRHGVHWGVENGHLSDPDPSWTLDPDWQQGFTTIEVVGGLVSIVQRHITDGRLLADGKLWTAEEHGTREPKQDGLRTARRVAGRDRSPRDRKPLAKRAPRPDR